MNQIIQIPKVAALPDVIPCHLISYIVAEFLPNMPKVIANPSAFEPPHIILPTATHHTHTVIALHDRGSNGLEFSEELFEGNIILWIKPSRPVPKLEMGLSLLPRAVLDSLPRENGQVVRYLLAH